MYHLACFSSVSFVRDVNTHRDDEYRRIDRQRPVPIATSRERKPETYKFPRAAVYSISVYVCWLSGRPGRVSEQQDVSEWLRFEGKMIGLHTHCVTVGPALNGNTHTYTHTLQTASPVCVSAHSESGACGRSGTFWRCGWAELCPPPKKEIK